MPGHLFRQSKNSPLDLNSESTTPLEAEQFTEIVSLMQKYHQAGPRYTSYPTAPEWKPGYQETDYRKLLSRLKGYEEEPISLYLHIPFCEERCLFCACNVTVRSDHSVANRYLAHLEKEISLVSDSLGFKPKVQQLHWGGGTPTYLNPDQIRRLMAILNTRFDINYLSGELSVEIDPVVTTAAHIQALSEEGFNRFSFGVQDFDPKVQETVRRIQTFEDTARLVQEARFAGAQSINIDLIYGLPYQTKESFLETLRKVLVLNPDRVAMFSYAHVPWMHKHQTVLEKHPRPDAEAKMELLVTAREFFEANGYFLIGLDHFAKPEDELYEALNNGTLKRNFMGYTVLDTENILAFGNSAIGYVLGSYIQNDRTLKGYEDRLDSGFIPVETGYKMTRDDFIRKTAIMDIMISFAVFFDDFKRKTTVEFLTYFAAELKEMQDLLDDGLVRLFPDRFVVTEKGELFLRTIAMRFDRFLKNKPTENRFSSTV